MSQSKANISDIANNLITTVAGKMLDARQGKALSDEISNKITSGSYRNIWLINTNPTVTFSDGTANIGVETILNAYNKGLVNVYAQLQTGERVVMTSWRVLDSTHIQLKCTNLTGTAYEGNMAVSIFLLIA